MNNTEAGRYSIDCKFPETIGRSVVALPRYMGEMLPKQILRLRGYRVAIGGSSDANALANALAAGVLFLDFSDSNGESVLSKYHAIDSVPRRVLFSISLDDKAITHRDSLNKVLYLKKDLPDTVYVTIYIKTEDPVTLIPSLTVPSYIKEFYLDFETQTGSEFNVSVNPKVFISP